MRAGPRPLAPAQAHGRGFSFIRDVQPILDAHCIRCHYDDRAIVAGLGGKPGVVADVAKGEPRAFSLQPVSRSF